MTISCCLSRAQSRGFISLGPILLLVIGLAVLGGAGWFVSQRSVPESATEVVATTTTPTTTTGTAPSPVKASIEVLGLDWATEGKLPQVLYKVSDLPDANIAISLVRADIKTIWTMEDVESSLHSGVGVLNLNNLRHVGGVAEVPPGDYALELNDFHTGAFIAKSGSFTIPAGGGR